jgi:uncharacterized protein
VVARDDQTTPTDLALAAYERALEPKKLVIVPGTHFQVYDQPAAYEAAVAWFCEHLLPTA